jgi:hypothetical protein
MYHAARLPVVKGIDITEPIKPDNVQPGTLRVYRKWFPDSDLAYYMSTPDSGAGMAMEIIASMGGLQPHPNLYVQVWNEEGQRLGAGLEEVVRLHKEAAVVLHAAGFKVLGYGFSTGNPERADWLYLQQHNYGDVDAIGLNEYWGNQGFTIWNALRHRMVHAWLEDHPPFIITECGIDAVEGAAAGWKKSGLTGQEYLAELDEYANLLDEDDYVLGAAIFIAGPLPDWHQFNIEELDLTPLYGVPPLPQEDTINYPANWIDMTDDFDEAEWMTFSKRRETRAILIHHTVTPTDDPEALWHSIAAYHMSIYGGIGYHIGIDPDGTVRVLGGLDTQRAHIEMLNHLYIGVALLGDFTTEGPPPAQLAAARAVVDWLRNNKYGDIPHMGHRDVPYATACPGNTYQDWIALEGATVNQQVIRTIMDIYWGHCDSLIGSSASLHLLAGRLIELQHKDLAELIQGVAAEVESLSADYRAHIPTIKHEAGIE